jgi:CDGSH-type Zn-finger protein
MARLVRHTETKPYRIDPKDFPIDGKAIWICACGLSRSMPYCDKSHKACAAEVEGTLYVYDSDGQTVKETRPDQG